MLKEAGLGCGPRGEEEREPRGVLVAPWLAGDRVWSTPSAGSGLLGLFMGSEKKWVSFSSTPGQDGQGTRWGHAWSGDMMEPLSDPWLWICTGCHSLPGALHVQG